MELTTILSWLATLVVLISFTLDGKKLRWVNAIGAGLWLLWGILVGEHAVIFLNGVIIGIHAWKLIQLSIEKR
jgi:hypothetical protein